MKINSAHIRDFKRFTDLTVADIAESARLVVLIGPNGSGKTSLFEAFNFWSRANVGYGSAAGYYEKAGTEESVKQQIHLLRQKIEIDFHSGPVNPAADTEQVKKSFYFRTAYRYEPDFTAQAIARVGDPLDDQKRPQMLVSADTRVSDNYQRLVGQVVEAVFESGEDDVTVRELRDKIIGEVGESLTRVFPDLALAGIGHPTADGTFTFTKGEAKDWRYVNLSGGEKAAFDLLLDFVVKSRYFDDTVFCVDEPELHMHTRLQAQLLAELYRKLADGCQLWIATHSIGMLRQAMDLHQQDPGAVAFLDFEDQDFDRPVTLRPATVDRALWKRVFRGALNELAELVAPGHVILCEGARRDGRHLRNTEFDAKVYRRVFATTRPDAEFISFGGANQVERSAIVLSSVFGEILKGVTVTSVLDRDDRSDDEMRELSRGGTRVLRRRDLESYLWDDEILHRLCVNAGREDAVCAVLAKKQRLLADLPPQGRPADDVKAVSGPLYVYVKQTLDLRQAGNTAAAFALAQLAPLVQPGTTVFRELDEDVFGTPASGPRTSASTPRYDGTPVPLQPSNGAARSPSR